MGKVKHNKELHGRRTSRSLFAITLAASLAAFGCTTNQNLGNGTPTRSGPDVRTAPSSGVTSGGETTTPPSMPPPMTSSYTRSEVLPAASSRTIRRSPAEAAAIMARHQADRGRYLGVVSPGASSRSYVSDAVPSGQFQNPALAANPQLTVNSSISSQPNAVINSGAGGTAAGAGVTLTTGGMTAAATIGGVTTPAGAAVTLPPGVFAGTGSLPTFASSGIPTVTAASTGAGRGTTAGARTTGTTTVTTAPATATATTGALGSASGPVRVLRGTNGGVTLTNVNTTATPPRTTGGRNQ